jgi:hypothetical protein
VTARGAVGAAGAATTFAAFTVDLVGERATAAGLAAGAAATGAAVNVGTANLMVLLMLMAAAR